MQFVLSWEDFQCFYIMFCCSHPVKNAWDEQKSVVRNLKDMGLSADPNKSLRIETTRVSVQNFYSCLVCLFIFTS